MMDDDIMEKGYLQYVIENCEIAFDQLLKVHGKLLEEMKSTSGIDVLDFGRLHRVIQDYLIIRVAGLFDDDSCVISFENIFKNKDNEEYTSIKKQDIIKYIIKLRHNFVGHNNKKFIKKGSFPETYKILESNLKELLGKLKILVS